MKRLLALLLILMLLLSGCGKTEKETEPEAVPGVDAKSGEWTGRGGSFTLSPVEYPKNCQMSFAHEGTRYYFTVPDFEDTVILRGEQELCRVDGFIYSVDTAEDGFWYSTEDRAEDGCELVMLTRLDYDGVRQEEIVFKLPAGCYFRRFLLAGDAFCLNCSDRLRVYDRAGSLLADIPHAEWSGQLIKGSNGEIYFVEPYETSGGAVGRVDLSGGRIEPQFSYPTGAVCPGDAESALILILGDGLYHLGTEGETVPLVIWEECGLALFGVMDVEAEADGSYLLCGTSFSPMRLSPADPGELKARTRLTLGVMGLHGSLPHAVAAFNARSADCCVQLVDLREGGFTPEQALTRLNTQLISGEGPDMLAFSGQSLSPFPFLRKGLLRDLEADVAADPDIALDDLWTALPIKNDCGGLYLMAADFSIETRLGLRETFGDADGWSFDSYLALARSTPDDRVVMYNLTRDYFLDQSASRFLRQAINWQTGTCDFDNPAFIELLEATRDMKETPEDLNNMVFGINLMADGYMATDLVMLNRVTSLARETRRIGKPVAVIGWPTPDGSCGTDMGMNLVGVLNTSEHAAECWSFLKDSLLHPSAIPAYEPLIRAELNEARQIEPAEDQQLFSDMLTAPISAAEEQQFYRMLDAIEHTTLYDETVMSIIREEAAAFLAGQRTAEETARLVQSRVSLYVSEQA